MGDYYMTKDFLDFILYNNNFYLFTEAFIDGRLTICITKFDDNYSKQVKRRDSGQRRRGMKEELVTTEVAIAKVKKDVSSVFSDFSEDAIIPLSGKWAFACSEFERSDFGEDEERAELRSEALDSLKGYPSLSLPGGEDNSHDAIIEKLPDAELIEQLEVASGVKALKERYG